MILFYLVKIKLNLGALGDLAVHHP